MIEDPKTGRLVSAPAYSPEHGPITAGNTSSALSSSAVLLPFLYPARRTSVAFFGTFCPRSKATLEKDLPSNLQGVWQNRVGDHNRVPWGSDYHMNVNLQMNYWPTYSTNMAECAVPIVDYVYSLMEPGKITAKTYFGVENGGFTAHTQNTPFGWTCPGWSFSWGWSLIANTILPHTLQIGRQIAFSGRSNC